MPPSEVIYQLLDFAIYPHKRAVNTLDSSNLKRCFSVCNVLARAFAAYHLCQFQQAEVPKMAFLVYFPGNRKSVLKSPGIEYMAPNFNPQTNHSITAWMTNCEEMQHVTAWFICPNKCFVQFSKNDGSNDRE